MENSNLENISKNNKQFELFSSSLDTSSNLPFSNNLKVRSKTLTAWRNRISDYQSKIMEDNQNNIFQQSIIPEDDNIQYARIQPFSLQGLSLNFWRTNQYVHNGPAMYFVIDTIGNSQIILYIGETNSANKRWKGEHDCKNYLSNYKEAVSYTHLTLPTSDLV